MIQKKKKKKILQKKIVPNPMKKKMKKIKIRNRIQKMTLPYYN
jgi:hypothetical protein